MDKLLSKPMPKADLQIISSDNNNTSKQITIIKQTQEIQQQ